MHLTEISFYFNAPDKLAFACRLLRKAVNGGTQVVVVAEPETLAKLDTLLWAISPLDFIAHCFANADPALVAASPILLGMPTTLLQGQSGSFDLQAPSLDAIEPVRPVLVNLGHEVPQGFERFERLLELVGEHEEDRLNARDRWKHYAHRGYAIIRHDLAAKLPA